MTDETDRRHLARIRSLLLDVQNRHRRLMTVIQKTADEYLVLQADALKLRPLTRLPDLENDILDPLLRASERFLSGSASPIFEAISGTLSPLLLDIAATLAAFEPDMADSNEPELPFELGEPTRPLELPFDDATIARTEDLYARRS